MKYSLKILSPHDDRDVVVQLALLHLPMLQLAMTQVRTFRYDIHKTDRFQGGDSSSLIERYCKIALDTDGFPKRAVVSMKAVEWVVKTRCRTQLCLLSTNF